MLNLSKRQNKELEKEFGRCSAKFSEVISWKTSALEFFLSKVVGTRIRSHVCLSVPSSVFASFFSESVDQFLFHIRLSVTVHLMDKGNQFLLTFWPFVKAVRNFNPFVPNVPLKTSKPFSDVFRGYIFKVVYFIFLDIYFRL